MKTVKTSYIIIGLIVLIFGGFGWSIYQQPRDPDIVARSGMHWHPKLAIYVKGEKQEIPANVGIGAVHQPMHTHSEDSAQGVIHLEFPGMVRTEDIMLRNFFEIWGKDIRSFGANMRMTVNGTENGEYENYIMKDGDTIELHYD